MFYVTLRSPSHQFTVAFDASGSGVGDVLSHCSYTDQKLHPCAFFSRHLTPAERNYCTLLVTQELLAVKLALEDWRHWLEEAEHTFIVWADLDPIHMVGWEGYGPERAVLVLLSQRSLYVPELQLGASRQTWWVT